MTFFFRLSIPAITERYSIDIDFLASFTRLEVPTQKQGDSHGERLLRDIRGHKISNGS